MYLQIAVAEDIFPWSPIAKDGGVYTSKFHLRVLPDEENDAILLRHSKDGQTNWRLVVADRLDYCITKWEHVQSRGKDLDCTKAHKLLLPTPIKEAILHLCVDKHLGEATKTVKPDPQ